MENDYQTPMKSHDGAGDGTSTIAHGLTDQKGMTESKLQHQHEEEQQNDRNEEDKRLDQIEKQIHEIGEQLRTLHLEISTSTDHYSEDLLNKERYRSELKKRIIDLDYEHKQLISKRIQEERRQKEEKTQQWKRQLQEREQQRRQELQEREQRRKQELLEREQKRREEYEQLKQEREERERKRLEELDKYEQEYRERLRNLSGSRKEERKAEQRQGQESQQEGSQQQQGQQSKVQGQGSQTVEDELARSRRRLRIAEIEAELAVSRLQRSRVTSLTTELEALRLSYLDPYYVYRPLALPSYYYPYSAYPVYSRWWYY